ncbi:MAG: lamin tail domain-containing protein [Haloplanus sp.]
MTKRERVTGLLVALLVVVAGCGGVADPSPATTTGGSATVRVTHVVDGDTVDVRFADGRTESVRLVGVDTPEVRGGVHPAEFGVPDTETGRSCLRRFADRASAYATRRLADRRVTLRYDHLTGRRDRYDRILAYVVVDGSAFNAALLEGGYARFYDTPFEEYDRYAALERDARADGRGLWSCAAGTATANASLVVARVHADAAGRDGENLDDEYVVFRNAGAEPLSLAGWTVTDEAGHAYVFGNRTLAPGAELVLRTGTGTDDDSTVYWDRTSPVWNNGGDVVRVTDDHGRVVLETRY